MTFLWKATAGVRLWAFKNVFLLFLVGPRILALDEQHCIIEIPLGWRTRNHLKSMYFGALCIGADLAGGLIAFHLMRLRNARVSFVFKDVQAQFLKRPEGTVRFTCQDGPAIQELMNRTLESGERQGTTVSVIATVPKKLGDEPVAKFSLTLSLKRSAS